MPKWEYLTIYLNAEVTTDLDEFKELVNASKFSKYSPVALMPLLNKFGEDGWEMISCHPYSVGDNRDVLTHSFNSMTTTAGNRYTHTYLCVFKRPKVE